MPQRSVSLTRVLPGLIAFRILQGIALLALALPARPLRTTAHIDAVLSEQQGVLP
jgi:hypothetical protein